MATPWQYDFNPLPKQREALIADVDEVLYGGSLGSGKSEVLLAACMTVCTLIPNAKALLVRRTYPELAELVKRLRERVPTSVARYNKSDHTFYFANGAELVLGYLNGPDDATRYQGHEFVLVCFDELTHYDKESYVLLMSRLRATGQVAADMKRYGLALRALSASNPGSKGHMWVKQRFIDPAPKHTVFTGTEDGDHTRRIFIPARIYDNPFLDHEDYLRKLGPMDPELKRAMVEGDWDIVSGVRFGQWRESIHVIDPSMIPISHVGHVRGVGVDYGISAPFAALWGAKLADDLIVIYREVGGTGYTPAQQAAMIRDAEDQDERRPERPLPIALDSACWAKDPTQLQFGKLAKDEPPPGSIASYYRDVFGAQVVPSKKDRIGGWALIDHHLAVREDKLPRILVYNTCRELIRTLPSLPRAKNNPEDLDTNANDHYADALRYLVQELTGKTAPTKPDPRDLYKRPETITGDLVGAGF